MTFIDDYSNMAFVDTLKHRSDVSISLKSFLELVSKQREERVKAIRTDNAPEYISEEFEAILDMNKITHQFSVPYCPQQNGTAERMNRTLQDMIRCMLDQAKLPESFWAEALRNAAYLRNRLPTKVLEGKTPKEIWIKTKPNLDHVRIFGCKAFAHLPEALRRTKLDRRGVECLFMGYCSNMKAYRLLEKGTNRIRNARNVVFDEKALMENGRIDQSREQIIDQIQEIKIPSNFQEAIESENSREWINAMQEEYTSLIENNTWELVERKVDQNVITCKWVYSIKQGPAGEINRFKARLVARGFTQKPGIDYSEI